MLLKFSYMKRSIDNLTVHPWYFTLDLKEYSYTNANKIQNQTSDYVYTLILLKIVVKIQTSSTR